MNTIRNVVFDLGGVLVELDIERCRRAFRDLGMEAVAEIVQPYYPVEVIGRLEGGEISFHEACDEMRRLAGRPDIPDERIAWAYGQFLVDVPVAKLRVIERLRSRGIRTYVLSNNNPASMLFIRGMFRADGHTMEEYFDRIYLSYEMHDLKPSDDLPADDRRQRHASVGDALHRRRCEEHRHGPPAGIRGLPARPGRGFHAAARPAVTRPQESPATVPAF